MACKMPELSCCATNSNIFWEWLMEIISKLYSTCKFFYMNYMNLIKYVNYLIFQIHYSIQCFINMQMLANIIPGLSYPSGVCPIEPPWNNSVFSDRFCLTLWRESQIFNKWTMIIIPYQHHVGLSDHYDIDECGRMWWINSTLQ